MLLKPPPSTARSNRNPLTTSATTCISLHTNIHGWCHCRCFYSATNSAAATPPQIRQSFDGGLVVVWFLSGTYIRARVHTANICQDISVPKCRIAHLQYVFYDDFDTVAPSSCQDCIAMWIVIYLWTGRSATNKTNVHRGQREKIPSIIGPNRKWIIWHGCARTRTASLVGKNQQKGNCSL